MNRITRSELLSLTGEGNDLRVSMYVPLERTFPESTGNPLRLKHALFEAETGLRNHGLTAQEAKRLLEPAEALASETELRRGATAESLAVFVSPSLCRTYPLPYPAPPSVDVGSLFYVTPLTPLLDWAMDAYVLALGANDARFCRFSREGLSTLPFPPHAAASMAEFTKGTEFGRPLRFQTGASAAPAGMSTTIVHGGTSYKDEAKLRLHEYVQAVAKHIAKAIDQEPLPLALAATKELQPVFREAYPGGTLLAEGVLGSADELSDQEIEAETARVLERQRQETRQDLLRRYRDLVGTNRSVNILEQVLTSAHEGRIDELLVATGERAWGSWDPESRRAIVAGAPLPGRLDLVDLAVQQTLQHGGKVELLSRDEMPEGKPTAALLRW